MNAHAAGARLSAVCCLLGLLFVGCVPVEAVQQAEGGATVAASAPHTLVVAIQAEPTVLNPLLGAGRSTGGGASQVYLIVNNYLVIVDDQGESRPQLASKLISATDGSWRVNPDGTMDTTWTLRPGEKWQDGTPFTADDLVFTHTAYSDPDIPFSASVLPGASATSLKAMASVSAPDPQTFVVHWSSVSVDAGFAPNLVPLPRHLLEPVYQSDKSNFINSPTLTTQFVGLGAYRLDGWQPGVEMDFTRFDGYYLGRPPLDRVVARIIADANTMIANILAGSVDVVLPLGVAIDDARQIEERWRGTGNQVILNPTGGLNFMTFQLREEYSRPQSALGQLGVRQALADGTDREAIAMLGSGGASPAADSWFPPGEHLREQTADALVQFPFDAGRAQRLLAESGWVVGPDHILRSQRGEPFETEIRAAPVNSGDKTTAVIAAGWQALGAQVDPVVVPASQAGNAEYRATFPGAQITGNASEAFYTTILASQNVAGPENRWSSPNVAGYRDSTVDGLIRSLAGTIDPTERLGYHRALLTKVLGDAIVVPLWWTQAPTLVLASVHGIRGLRHGANTWNIFEWTKD